MIEAGRGSIVNLHSVEGMRGYPGEPVYAAMKAARRTSRPRSPQGSAGTASGSTASVPTSRRPPSRLSPTARGRRPRCLARLDARRPGRVAGGDRPHHPVPCVGPEFVHHRPQHPGRRRNPRPEGQDLQPARRTVREPTDHPVRHSGDDPHRTHFEAGVIANGTKLDVDGEAKVTHQPQHRRLGRSRRAIAGLQRPRQA